MVCARRRPGELAVLVVIRTGVKYPQEDQSACGICRLFQQFRRLWQHIDELMGVNELLALTTYTISSLQRRGESREHPSDRRSRVSVVGSLSNILKTVLSPTFPKGPQHAPGSHKSTHQTGKAMFFTTQ